MATETAPPITIRGTGDLTVASPYGLKQSAPRVTFTGDGDLVVAYETPFTDWRATITTASGDAVWELPDAAIRPLVERLNTPASTSVELPISHPGAVYLTDQYFRELQLWRGNTLLFWGPLTGVRSDGNTVRAEAADALWHLGRRFVGGAQDNDLTNPDFDDGFDGWLKHAHSSTGFVSTNDTEFSLASDIIVAGTVQSAVVWNDDEDSGKYLQITQAFTVDGGDYGKRVSFVAHGYVGNLQTGYTAKQSIGLRLRVFDESKVQPIPPTDEAEQSAEDPITARTQRSRWLRYEAAVDVPAGETKVVQAALCAPDGLKVLWGRARLTVHEALNAVDVDQAAIVRQLVAHAQDTDLGKSDVGLTATASSCPDTGIKRDREYPYSERVNVLQAVREFTRLDDGMDVSLQVTPTTRVVRTHHPRRGDSRPGLPFYVDRQGGTVELLDWHHDGDEAASRVFAMSRVGRNRDEATAADTTLFSGLTLESREFTDLDTVGGGIDAFAEERLDVRSNPEVIKVRTLPGDRRGVDVQVGDEVPVVIKLGREDANTADVVDVDGTFRVIAKTWRPDSDSVDFTLNRGL